MPDELVYCPSALVRIFSNFVITPTEKKVLRIRGTYCDRAGPDYAGYYYDRLKDETSGDILTVKVPALLKGRLRDNRPYVFEGFIDRKTRSATSRELNIYLFFVVTQMISEEEPLLNIAEYERTEIFKEKREAGHCDVDATLKNMLAFGRKPKLCIIYGMTAIVDEDVISAIGEERSCYEIVEQRINLANKDGIIETLEDLDQLGEYDVIALVRGGGSLEVFDDNDIARSVVRMSTPLVVAIGHAANRPFIEVVADRYFSTPTAFGGHLKLIAQTTFQEVARQQAFVEREQQYRQQIIDLTAAKDGLQKENKELYQRPPTVVYRESPRDEPVGLQRADEENGPKPLTLVLLGVVIGAIIAFLLIVSFQMK